MLGRIRQEDMKPMQEGKNTKNQKHNSSKLYNCIMNEILYIYISLPFTLKLSGQVEFPFYYLGFFCRVSSSEITCTFFTLFKATHIFSACLPDTCCIPSVSS
jgi:hypothetical protein